MQPPHQQSRMNLAELRAQLVKKLGPEGSKQYFYYLQRFLSLKVSKIEFNKLCLRILGRENIPLHNQFIRSILRNACSGKAPPPPHQHQNGSHISTTVFCDRPNGRTSFSTAIQSNDFSVKFENGDLKNPVKELSPPLEAPLGVPFCPASIGGAHRAPLPPSRFIGSSLRERMEHIAVSRGLEGVSLDCADILNRGLDSYLKGLIRSCIELVGARARNHQKLINGVKQKSGEEVQEQTKIQCPISLQDFRVAMELNPRQLGEDWPLLLEKICTHAFEE